MRWTGCRNLAEVPEVYFQEPLTNSTDAQEAQRRIARVMNKINYVNAKKTDAFLVTLAGKRPTWLACHLPWATNAA